MTSPGGGDVDCTLINLGRESTESVSPESGDAKLLTRKLQKVCVVLRISDDFVRVLNLLFLGEELSGLACGV
ncbi:MAG: hypothetical protein ACXV2A_05825 [Halobacteriota archaeon]